MIHFSEIAFKIFVWVLEICGNEDILYLSTEREQALTVKTRYIIYCKVDGTRIMQGLIMIEKA